MILYTLSLRDANHELDNVKIKISYFTHNSGLESTAKNRLLFNFNNAEF